MESIEAPVEGEAGAVTQPAETTEVSAVLPDVTDPEQWRALTAPQYLRLPSGVRVMAKRPDWILLRGAGVISEDDVRAALTGGNSSMTEKVAVARVLMPYIVTRPKVVKDGEPYDRTSAIAVSEIPDSDAVAAFMWAIGLYANKRETVDAESTKDQTGSGT